MLEVYSFPPHPNPLPRGEGATHQAGVETERRHPTHRDHHFPLSLWERVRVRGKGAPCHLLSLTSVTAIFAMLILLPGLTISTEAAEIPPEKLNTLIGALTRLGPDKVNANPRLKDALGKVLDATKGTEQFVELVQVFKLTDRNAELVEMAIANPNSNAGVASVNHLLGNNGNPLLAKTLSAKDVKRATSLVQAIGNTLKSSTIPLLLPLLESEQDTGLQKETVRSLAKFKAGAQSLLKLADTDSLPDGAKLTAAMALNSVRWKDIREHAAKTLPLPKSKSGESFPAIAELVKKTGDAKRGQQIYSRETVACNRCHQINGEGIDFGPALSEIGSKLTKEALFESILAPNSGILMGYESWSIETKDGDEFYGLLVSETKNEIAIKTVGGIVNRIKKSDIEFQRKSSLSTMPSGLQQLMSMQDMVDLVEYLATLKKMP